MASLKLDENLPDSFAVVLRDGGHDVAFARNEGLAGADDVRLLQAAASEGRALVTLDKDFTNILRHPPAATAGVIVLRLRDQTLPAIQRSARALTQQLYRNTLHGRLWVFDESRLRIWPSVS